MFFHFFVYSVYFLFDFPCLFDGRFKNIEKRIFSFNLPPPCFFWCQKLSISNKLEKQWLLVYVSIDVTFFPFVVLCCSLVVYFMKFFFFCFLIWDLFLFFNVIDHHCCVILFLNWIFLFCCSFVPCLSEGRRVLLVFYFGNKSLQWKLKITKIRETSENLN